MTRDTAIRIIENALREGRHTLSEFESKQVLALYNIPVTRELLIESETDLEKAVADIGFPLVMKGCSAAIAHKTEKGLIHVDLRNAGEALEAYDAIMQGLDGHSGGVLIQEMIRGRRELVMGLTRDPQFGPCVMFGLGGIFTEILRDVTFRKAPLEKTDAVAMMHEIKGHRILDALRGMAAANTDTLADMLIRVGQIGLDIEHVEEIDLNPVIISGTKPVVVDALIVLK
jgi:succinyl-CoA synthetase beta subunit